MRCSAGRMVESFALTFEALRRIVGIRLYDQQFLSGMLLCRGMIAEMATGEGKTFCASLAGDFLRASRPERASGDAEHLSRRTRLRIADARLSHAEPLDRDVEGKRLRRKKSVPSTPATSSMARVTSSASIISANNLPASPTPAIRSDSTIGTCFAAMRRVGYELSCPARRGDHRRNRLGAGR